MTSLFAAYNDQEGARKREQERDRFIHSDEHKNMWIKQGFAKEIVDKYPEEFFYMDWSLTHCGFPVEEVESYGDFHAGTIHYFLNKDYSVEFLAEYFSHEWKMDKSEVEAFITKVKAAQA